MKFRRESYYAKGLMNIIDHKYIFLSVSGFLVLASVIAISVWGFKPGIDFTGGSLLEVRFKVNNPSNDAIKEKFVIAGVENAIVQSTEERGAIIRFRHIDEVEHQKIISGLQAIAGSGGVEERRFDTIGSTVGAELRQKSILALGLSVVGIILYIAWAFRKVSKPLPSWKYGVVAILALIHDVTIPSGLFAILGNIKGVEVDSLFITALLTILGFSVHDTIVVFDRIRENLRNSKGMEPFEVTVGTSIKETIGRSINTSLTVLLVVASIFLFGGTSTMYFALALGLGIMFGTYSSIFVASPLLVIWNEFQSKRSK